jgi:hypothetical protein
MPNLYFCQPHAQNQGMLRAVLSMEDCGRLVRPESTTFLGDHFPAFADAPDELQDFAVVGVGAAESSKEWQAGYYRFAANLTELNAALLRL